MENGNYYRIFGVIEGQWKNGNYYRILGVINLRDNGKEHGLL